MQRRLLGSVREVRGGAPSLLQPGRRGRLRVPALQLADEVEQLALGLWGQAARFAVDGVDELFHGLPSRGVERPCRSGQTHAADESRLGGVVIVTHDAQSPVGAQVQHQLGELVVLDAGLDLPVEGVGRG